MTCARCAGRQDFDEPTRGLAAALLHRLCLAWGDALDSEAVAEVVEGLLDSLAHTSPAASVLSPVSPRHLAPLRGLQSVANAQSGQ